MIQMLFITMTSCFSNFQFLVILIYHDVMI